MKRMETTTWTSARFTIPSRIGELNIEHRRRCRVLMGWVVETEWMAIPTGWQRNRNWWYEVPLSIGLNDTSMLLGESKLPYSRKNYHLILVEFSRLVAAIGETYGLALLLHMLTSTIMLTLLAYQATKIEGVNVYALSVIGYLVYALAQVFLFCIFGNRLIEEVRKYYFILFYIVQQFHDVMLNRAHRWWKLLTLATGTTDQRKPKLLYKLWVIDFH